MATKNIISSLESRVDQLISDHKRLGDLCRSLQSERDMLLAQKREMQEQMKSLEHQLSVLQLCEGLGSSTATASRDESRNRARARVNRLMREVDKCINLLSATEDVKEKEE
ncbi:MAG: hypothetical protein SNG10_03325 [Rikenellaceae bacterium]